VRYRLLETIRQYAGEKLVEAGEAAATRDRHRDWYVALAERAEPELRGAGQEEWLQRLAAEHDNLRAALAWSLESDPGAGLRLAGNLWRFWAQRGYYAEGRYWVEAVLARASTAGSPEDQRARAWALAGAGNLAEEQGNRRAARAYLEESLTLFRAVGDRRGVAHALRTVGMCLLADGEDAEQVGPMLEESLGLARSAGDQRNVGVALVYLGYLAARERDDPRAQRLLAEGLALFRQIGDTWSTSEVLGEQGWFYLGRGDLQGARRRLEEGLAIARRLGHKKAIGLALLGLGCLARLEGDRRGARELLAGSVQLLQELGIPGIHDALGYLGHAGVERGLYAWGVRLLAFATTGPPAYSDRAVFLPSALKTERDARLATARAALGEDAFAAAWAEGQAMTLEQATAEVLSDDGPQS
jgi:tetratricopeptide (TPR) repeat protein